MSVYDRAFEPIGATQNVAMDGTAKTITLTQAAGDRNTSVNIVIIGTQTVFVRVDGTTAATTTAKPLLANTDQTLSMPPGVTTVKLIGAAGSTAYVTAGRGV